MPIYRTEYIAIDAKCLTWTALRPHSGISPIYQCVAFINSQIGIIMENIMKINKRFRQLGGQVPFFSCCKLSIPCFAHRDRNGFASSDPGFMLRLALGATNRKDGCGPIVNEEHFRVPQKPKQ